MTSSTLEPENNNEALLRPGQNPNNGRGRRGGSKSSSSKNRGQLTFFFSCIVVVLILIPFTMETYRLVEDYLKYKPAGYEWPSVGDFWFTLVATPVFWTLEQLFQYLLYPWYYKICKE